MKELNIGDKFYGTNADLLNELGFLTKQGLPFKGWQKSTFELDSNTFIWLASIDGVVRNGWSNIYQGNEIIEQNPDNNILTIGLTHSYRVVFDKIKDTYGNVFIFKGLYKLSPESNNQVRILEKISNHVKL